MVADTSLYILQDTRCGIGARNRGFRAITLMSVMAKWYCSVVINMVINMVLGEGDRMAWRMLHVGAERGDELRTHAGAAGQCLAKALGMVGGPGRCVGAGNVRVSDRHYDKLGRENGLWRGQAWGGVADIVAHRNIISPLLLSRCTPFGHLRWFHSVWCYC